MTNKTSIAFQSLQGTSNKLRKVRLQIQLANNLPVLRESIRHLLERVR